MADSPDRQTARPLTTLDGVEPLNYPDRQIPPKALDRLWDKAGVVSTQFSAFKVNPAGPPETWEWWAEGSCDGGDKGIIKKSSNHLTIGLTWCNTKSLSDDTKQFLREKEGFRDKLYNDEADHCTIGFGHLVHMGPCDGTEPEEFKQGITREQGEELFRKDIAPVEANLNAKVDVYLNQNQFDALGSMGFNIGIGKFNNSSLLKILNKSVWPYSEIGKQIERWNRAGGKESSGLTRRRKAERSMFEEPGQPGQPGGPPEC